jgi:hypothetical protein
MKNDYLTQLEERNAFLEEKLSSVMKRNIELFSICNDRSNIQYRYVYDDLIGGEFIKLTKYATSLFDRNLLSDLNRQIRYASSYSFEIEAINGLYRTYYSIHIEKHFKNHNVTINFFDGLHSHYSKQLTFTSNEKILTATRSYISKKYNEVIKKMYDENRAIPATRLNSVLSEHVHDFISGKYDG